MLFPRLDGSVANMVADVSDEYSNVNNHSSSSAAAGAGAGAITQSVVQRILNTGGEDSTPLTTQAVKDLQKAQKERIYARTLVRIK